MIRFLFVVLLFAAMVYLLVRLLDRRSGRVTWGPAARRHEQQPPPRRAIAPDDDDSFLRDLDRRRRNPQDPDDES